MTRYLFLTILILISCNASGFDPEQERRECNLTLAAAAKDISNEEFIALYFGCNVDQDLDLPDTRSEEDRE
jgi:hypothetical protein